MKFTQKIQLLFTIWICKLCSLAGKLLLGRGSSAPGALALRLCPWILSQLAQGVKGKTIVVSGTNGKTTSNNVLYAILKAQGKKVICNNSGANMLSGIVTAYINACSIFGRVDADYACIEVDEATATHAFDSIKPDYMVITNFFRDQLDRYGEIDIIVDLLKTAVDKVPDMVLLLNGDDPICAAFSHDSAHQRFFFGIDEQIYFTAQETKESRFCTFCHHELKYKYYHYSQLGDYYCENCGFTKPPLNYPATCIFGDGYLEFTAMSHIIRANLIGYHNIYNILAALSVASLLGVDLSNINDVLSKYKPQNGRMEVFTIGGVPVILNLSKNPAGFNQVITDMHRDTRKKNLVIIINDNPPDGTDVSWLWDVDFEMWNSDAYSEFSISGIRAEDVYLRLKYAGISTDKLIYEKDIKKAIELMLSKDNEVLYVLTNYTPLVETRKIIQKKAK
ncbi:MAG: Mur ligase family protein [Oscillospiraceae bacterium]|nr:Mur ligase family protein [Oscillospiraceae bacterium]